MQVKESVALFLIGCCAGVLQVRAQSPTDAGQHRQDTSIDPLPSLDESLPWRSMVDDPLGLEPSDEDLGKSLLRDMDADSKKKAKAGEAHLFGPLPPPYRAKEGSVVTAVASVRELEHKTEVHIAHGLAQIAVTMRFASISEKPAEVRYRLAIPSDSGLESLKVCNKNGCRTGVMDRPSELSLYNDAVLARGPKPTLPIAQAAFRKDSRGYAIVVRAAPIVKNSDVAVTLSYVSSIEQHNGIARLRLPARGMDPRAAPTTFEFSDSLRDDLVSNTPIKRDAWIPTEIVARTSETKRQIEAWRFKCDKELCGRVRVAAAVEPLRPVDLTLFVDASPSMVGPARGRVATAISVLLANAPPGTRARAFVFAARVKPIVTEFVDVNEIPLTSIANAIVESELGSSTRFENAWKAVARWTKKRRRDRNRALALIVGDGGLTTGRGHSKPFSEAKRAGIEVSVLNLADREAVPALREGVENTGGIIVNAVSESERASRGFGTAALEDRIAALFAKVAEKRVRIRLGRKSIDLGTLRSGEQLVWEGVVGSKRFRLFTGGRSVPHKQTPDHIVHGLTVRLARAIGRKSPREILAAVDPEDFRPSQILRPAVIAKKVKCDPRGPAWKKSGISSDKAPVALAERLDCRKPVSQQTANGPRSAEPGIGMPSEPLLFMLRSRIVPVARACFRRDRAGRPNYSKRAVFRFQLSEREVTSARIEGSVSQKLRKCLLSAVDTLDVPFFSGNVIVRYPLITETEPLPHQIELTPETAKQIDALLSESRPGSP